MHHMVLQLKSGTAHSHLQGRASSITSSRQGHSFAGSQACGQTLASSKPLLLHLHDSAKACNLLACNQMAWNQLVGSGCSRREPQSVPKGSPSLTRGQLSVLPHHSTPLRCSGETVACSRLTFASAV